MPVETFGIENTEAEEYKNNRSDDNSTVKDIKKRYVFIRFTL